MYGNDPKPGAGVQVHAERLTVVRRLLEEVSRREVLALSAAAHTATHFPWASLGPDSGLTAVQEDFVDYWTPELVLAECRSKRELICALDEWALTAASAKDHDFVSRLLALMVVDDAS
jgi:hypothetical protein